MKDNSKSGGRLLTWLIILFVFVVGIFGSLFVVKPNEYVVIRQFGRIIKVASNDGLNVKMPLVHSKIILPRNILLYDVPPTEINTLDKKRIVVDYYALWKITNPINMIESLKTISGAEARLSDIMYSNVRNELGKLEYGEIINPEDNKRGGVDEIVMDLVNEILVENKNGVEVVDIQMKRIDLPPTNEQSVYNRMISERQSKAQDYLSQGVAEARKINAEVDREVKETIAIAEAEAEKIIAEGQGEAARIYNDAYGKDSEFFRLYNTLESYRTVINKETVILLPINSPYLEFLRGI